MIIRKSPENVGLQTVGGEVGAKVGATGGGVASPALLLAGRDAYPAGLIELKAGAGQRDL